MSTIIETSRFHLRELNTADVTEGYLAWFQDADARKYISAAATTTALSELRAYVAERMNRRDVLFLGIFDRASGRHIGNVKFEPIDDQRRYAVMGILIGDAAFRGQGVAREVLDATSEWLRDHRGLQQILLGVHRDNAAAVRAYEAAGFVCESTPYIETTDPGGVTMVKRL